MHPTISITRGDSSVLSPLVFEVTDEDGNPIDLTGALARFIVKRRWGEPNANAAIVKSSRDDFPIVDALNGRLFLTLRKADTLDLSFGDYVFAAEYTRPGPNVTTAGSVALSSGSKIAIGSGVNFTDVKRGDLFIPTGVNTARAVVEEVNGNDLTLDFGGWANEALAPFQIVSGAVNTPEGHSGIFRVVEDAAD